MGERKRKRRRRAQQPSAGGRSSSLPTEDAVATIDRAFDRHDAFALLAGLSLASALPLRARRERDSSKLPSFVVEDVHGRAAQRAGRVPAESLTKPLPTSQFARACEVAAARSLEPLGVDGLDADWADSDEREAQMSLRV